MLDWHDRRVLVTGGAGFIGSNLCHELVRLEADVTVLDNFDRMGGANEYNLSGLDIKIVNEEHAYTPPRVLKDIEVIFGLAALTSHVGAQENPYWDMWTNTGAFTRIIPRCREQCPSAIVVHASTRQVYGRPDYLPVDERHPIRPPDCNAISKFAGEQYWLLEHRVHGRPVAVLRLTNVYGPRMRIRDARQNFYGEWVRRALKSEPIEVWGGAQLRDMAYVDDVVDALIRAADSPACWGRALNVGGADPVTLLQLADLTARLAGCAGRYEVRGMPPERAVIDIGSCYLDDREFREATGWEPQVWLQDGIGRTLGWFRDRLGEYT